MGCRLLRMFQARALAAQTAETDAIRFLVGTQSLKFDNQVSEYTLFSPVISMAKSFPIHPYMHDSLEQFYE